MGETAVEAVLSRTAWLGHDTFQIKTHDLVIYTDPYQLLGGVPADLILITHDHYDHCSPDDVARIQNAGTTIVGPADSAAKFKGKVKTVKPGDRLSVGGIDIEVVPAYNTNKKFHPKANGWVGYVFTVEGVRIYLAGDTDRIPEMKAVRCDIALLPIGGTYTMTAEEAALAAQDIKPKVAVPMHYASIVGTQADAEQFKKGLAGKVPVHVMSKRQGVGAP
jgi:L-ascorbate metabolism protein UlaG (beta-lactamase superfamily)